MVGAARTGWPDLVGAASTGCYDPGNGNRARSRALALVPPAPEFTRHVSVESNPPGASIWLDGADLGLVAPAAVPVAGEVGQAIQLQLRRDGIVVAAINLALGPEMPLQWAPEGVRGALSGS